MLHIYGAYVTEKVNQLHSKKEGFIIKGWADNTKEVFKNYKICLAPLRFGAGLKGKLIDTMLYGTPSVTTKIGAEAMHDNLPWNGFITDDYKTFAKKAVELHQNKSLWLKSQEKGAEIINKCYSKEKYSNLLFKSIDIVQKNITEHRLQNFTGQILQYHSLQSTKYLSKWIEEKNSK